MRDFDTALDASYAMYAKDIAADQTVAADVVSAVDQAIDRLKDLLRQNAFDSNAGTFHGLCRIGQLLDMRNRLTGEHRDVEYLFSDDGEFFRHVAGFIGDSAGVVDSQGRPLVVGDIVSADVRDSVYEYMVILSCDGKPMLPSKWMDDHNAVFLRNFSPEDMRTANKNPRCTVYHGSCLKDYFEARERARVQKKQRNSRQAER